MKTKTFRVTTALVGFVALLMIQIAPIVRSAPYKASVQAYGMDTVAGYEALLSISHAEPNSDVTVAVQKPDGSTVKIPAKTNDGGTAKLNLYDYHTRKAGEYRVMAYKNGQSPQGAVSSFTVYPDELSARTSEVIAQVGIGRADGNDKIYVTATLRDQYKNPLEGHSVTLISSRTKDTVARSGSGMTDANGSATFAVSSAEAGVSVFSALDVATGTVLNSRAQVAFVSGDSYIADAGGDFFGLVPAASAQTAGTLNRFEISGLPSGIQANQNVSFRVTAQDQNGITVQNYTGTVRFSATGANSQNVSLPEDYTFEASDLGTHEFSLGLQFTTEGTYTVQVRDVNNTLIAGETTVVVGSGSGSGTGNGSGTNQKPSIITPVSGTYSQNVQTISGSAPSGTTVTIFDNDQEIGSVQVGSNGSYSYQTAPLADGGHSLYVTSSDSQGTVLQTSPTVEVVIDTTPPAVDEVIIEPMTGIKTGDVMTVRVLSEPDLSEAALVFNSEIFELSPSLEQSGMYTATLQAPAEPGEYPLDVLVVDELGNEATYADEATISITADGTGEVTQEDETPEETPEEVPEETPEETPSGNAPSQVFGVIAFGSDQRVTLIWEAANDDGTIDHYKIYYGLDPVNLAEMVETNDAATTWYIPGLENGKEYYFAVAAVDNDGLESEERSELVNAIPFTTELETQIPERPDTELGAITEDPVLRGAARDQMPGELSEQGPELLWLLFGSGGASLAAGKLSRRKRKLQK